MSDFKPFSKQIKENFDKMSKSELYEVDLEKDELWELYLKSFPEGTNLIYKERTTHDCNCCKNFIRDVGSVVSIENGKLVSIWDNVNLGNEYDIVSQALSDLVKSKLIVNKFTHFQSTSGAEVSRQLLPDSSVKNWNHFYCSIPSSFVKKEPGDYLNEARTGVQVCERGLKELTMDSVDTVIELISQNSIYRGEEHIDKVKSFKTLKIQYQNLKSDLDRNIFVWKNYNQKGARLRNEVIGTLLIDLSEDKDLDIAVKSFETKVAPTNYKRPTALVTKGMIEQAMKTINELGIEDSLKRRFAIPEDLSVNNVLFVDRKVASVMKDNLMDSLMKEVKETSKDYSKIDEISIEEFQSKVLPNINSMEVLFEGKHTSNLMSIIAPVESESKNILKWNNNFSWSYNGNITDSIKERVKNAGGNIEAVMRTSLSWFNYDDLDLHVYEPNGNHIEFINKGRRHPSSGMLDVDMNMGGGRPGHGSRDAVENVTWIERSKMPKGWYKVVVRNYAKVETKDVGFVIQTEVNGKIENYSYKKAVGDKQYISVVDLYWNGETVSEVKIHKDIETSSISKEIWNINTEKFHKVNLLTISPNHWDDQKIGNKHWFFILEGCLNQDDTRGLYNEFLNADLDKHRKVFEVIGNKMKVEYSDKQLSGLGFSSTKRDELVVKVSGNFNRMLRIKF